jgi:hypothetical protein
MKVGIIVFGQFRSYKKWLESNIIELEKSLPGTSFDIFILSDKIAKGNYSKEAEEYIRNTLHKYSINIKLFAYWEDQSYFHSTDIQMNSFNKTFVKNNVSYGNDWMVNLWYRRYILWSMVKSICRYELYDYFLYCRLFDTEILTIKPLYEVISRMYSKNTLYTSIDTMFLGSPAVIDIVFQFGSKQENWKDFTWTDDLRQSMLPFDGNPSIIANTKHTMCSEAQIYYYLYTRFNDTIINYTKYKLVNLRYTYFYIEIRKDFSQDIVPNIIPKRILQIALGDSYVNSLPLDRMKDNIMKNNSDYLYELYTEKEAIELLERFPEYKHLYYLTHRPQYKSDIIRYLYLYTYGGWYIDIDLLPVVSLNSIYDISSRASLICVEGAHTTDDVKEMANGFLASREKNRVFLDLIDLMVKEPNPHDYGMNVKRCYSKLRSSAPLFTNENDTFVLKEKPVNGKYYIYCNDTMIVYSNGHQYPFKQHDQSHI